MSPPPRITVIIAVLNGAATLARCLDSILTQQQVTLEIVVIDGCSSDGTLEILQQYGDRLSYWESSADRSVYEAWNKGIRHARGDWICFLGADDRFADARSLALLQPTLAAADAQNIHMVYGKVDLLDARGRVLVTLGDPWHKARRTMRQKMGVPHPAVLHHRLMFERCGPFDASFRIAGDYDMMLRYLQQGDALFCDQVIVAMATGGLSTKPGNIPRLLAETQRAREQNGIFETLSWPRRLLRGAANILYRCLNDRQFAWMVGCYLRLLGLLQRFRSR